MSTINQLIDNFLAIIRTFRFKDAIDILAIGIMIFYLIKLIRGTRAVQLLKGLFVLLMMYGIAFLCEFTMLTAMLNKFFEFAVIVLLIVFQPELRKMLEQLGRGNYSYKRLVNLIVRIGDQKSEEQISKQKKNITVYVESIVKLSQKKTGALIVFERRSRLGDIATTGTIINAIPSEMLIGNIFYNKAPLHDGAMIVRDGNIYAAGCILPLTHNEGVDDNLGTRHRAALGMSEESDAVVLVVSEETGSISIALNGMLERDYTREKLLNDLIALLVVENNDSNEKFSFLNSTKKEKKKSE
ncbi:MAG: diadenylate cyclase CdaA [Acutalibacteraceae bacterium]|nr:diadenylate cyclase CdaA [Clostridia bacterium]MEE3449433.1 diadenylate cyclase CdaA [Acutalibacteraceae bacterium]